MVPKFPKFSQTTKNTLLGGVAASLTVYGESALSWFVPAYPQVLKDKIVPQLPRNGALVANVTPMVVAYAVTKKRSSARAEDMKTGVFIYDLPRLVEQVVYNTAYELGRPSQAVGLMLTAPAYNMRSRPVMLNIAASPMVSGGAAAGKYALKTSTPAAANPSGMGRYR